MASPNITWPEIITLWAGIRPPCANMPTSYPRTLSHPFPAPPHLPVQIKQTRTFTRTTYPCQIRRLPSAQAVLQVA